MSRMLLPGFLILPGLLLPGVLRGQDLEIDRLLSNDAFYDSQGILHAQDDVAFVADTWYLTGVETPTVLLGITLSNEALQFDRTSDGQWQANYEVSVVLEPEDGGETLEERWQKTIEVGTFDESVLTGETIVFQGEIPVPAGGYDISIAVYDRNADETSEAEGSISVPAFDEEPASLAGPVLLKSYEPGGASNYIVNPSHYYSAAPESFDFMVELAGLPPDPAPLTVRARLFEEGDDDEPDEPLSVWTKPVAAGSEEPVRVFGSVANDGARFGEYRLRLELEDSSGAVIDSASTVVLIRGSAGWIADHWEDALSLIRYEATGDELDILEDVEGQEERVAAWNCFWEIRDPLPTTAANEAMEEYFSRVQIANNQWRSSLRPGYLSDRGRVFMTLGPPDDIANRPVPAGGSSFEVWTYYRNNFQILFVDRIGFNNYEIENVSTFQQELFNVQRRKRNSLEERADTACPLLAPAFE